MLTFGDIFLYFGYDILAGIFVGFIFTLVYFFFTIWRR